MSTVDPLGANISVFIIPPPPTHNKVVNGVYRSQYVGFFFVQGISRRICAHIEITPTVSLPGFLCLGHTPVLHKWKGFFFARKTFLVETQFLTI